MTRKKSSDPLDKILDHFGKKPTKRNRKMAEEITDFFGEAGVDVGFDDGTVIKTGGRRVLITPPPKKEK